MKLVEINEIIKSETRLKNTIKKISEITITNQKDYDKIQTQFNQMKVEYKVVMKPYKDQKVELYKPYKDIMSKISEVEKKYKQVETSMKQVLSTYIIEQQRIAAEAEAKRLEAEAKLEKEQSLENVLEAKKPIEPEQEKPKQYGMRKHTTLEVEIKDKASIPIEFLIVDMGALKAFYKEAKTQIPGVVITEKERYV